MIQSNSHYIIALLTLFFQGCICQPPSIFTTNQNVQGIFGDANAGSLRKYSTGVDGSAVFWNDTAFDNTAQSVLGVANAGVRDIFGENAYVSNSSLDISNTATENEAISNRDISISGTQIVFSNIENGSSISESSDTSRNEASIIGNTANSPNPSAVSGSQTLTSSIFGSNFTQSNSAYQNIASNDLQGKAVSGVDTAFGDVYDSYISSNNSAVDNFAEAEYGRSVAGIQNNIKNVTDSRLYLISNSENNQAEAEYGNAVAGIENNFGTLQTSFPDGGVRVTTDGKAFNNTAVSTNDGKAIAGIGTNADLVEGTFLNVQSETADNTAVVKGESEKPIDSVAGVAVNINDFQSSTAVINATSNNNKAFNYNTDSQGTLSNDAIAGSQIIFGNADNSVINIEAEANDNYAYSQNGDAVAGNIVQILGSNYETQVTLNLDAQQNQAYSKNGDAVVDNKLKVSGDANLTIG